MPNNGVDYYAAGVRAEFTSRSIPLIAAGITLMACARHGAVVSTDSVTYLAVARNIAETSSFTDFLGRPLTLQAPLYPTLLAVVYKLSGGHLVAALPWLNSILFGAAVFLFVRLARFVTEEKSILLFLSILAVVSSSMVEWAVSALSEMSYIIVTLGFIILLVKYCVDPRVPRLAALIVVAALAPLVRYVGVTLIGAGALVLLAAPRLALRKRLVVVGCFTTLSVLPLLCWLARNYFVAHNLTGERAASMFSLAQNIAFTCQTVVGWFLPKRAQYLPHYTAAACALVALGFLLMLIPALRRMVFESISTHSMEARNIALAVLTLVFVFHCGFLIVTATLTAFDVIADRLMSPAFVCFLLLLGGVPFRRPVRFALLTVLLAVSILKSGKIIVDCMREGKGYTSVQWQQSPLVNFVVTKLDPQKIYSNIADEIYFRSGIKTQWLPRKYANHMTRQTAPPPSSAQIQAMKSGLIVYYQTQTLTPYPFLYTPDELRQWLSLKEIASFPDGKIYQPVK